MKQALYILALLLLFPGCSQKNKRYPVISTIDGKENISVRNINDFYKHYTTSMMGGHLNRITIKDSVIQITLSGDGKEIYVLNTFSNKVKTISLRNERIPTIPIDQIYYHNHDSIFIFFNRSAIKRLEYEQNVDVAMDFILIDSKGNVKNNYSLDNVPYIFNGRKYKSILPRNRFIKENQILGVNMYIPFFIYNPRPYQPGFNEFDPQLLCEYNLETKKIRMLNVRYPKEDIGKSFGPHVTESVPEFIFNKKKDKIYYVFHESPDIFELDIKANRITKVYRFDKDNFFDNTYYYDSNQVNDSMVQTLFYKPEYSAVKDIYIRNIDIRNYKNYKKKVITQIFDNKMNLLGYSIADTSIYFLYVLNGEICLTSKSGGKSYFQSLGKTRKMKVQEIEQRYFEVEPVKVKKSRSSKIMGLDSRLLVYLINLKIPFGSKTVVVNMDRICSSCVEILFENLKNRMTEYEEKKIYYVFYGANKDFAKEMLSNYKIPQTKLVVIDNQNKFVDYLSKEDFDYYFFIKTSTDGQINYVKSDFKEVGENLHSLLGD